MGNLAEYSLTYRFFPPPATLPHERPGTNSREPEPQELHRELSSNTLDRVEAQLKSSTFFI